MMNLQNKSAASPREVSPGGTVLVWFSVRAISCALRATSFLLAGILAMGLLFGSGVIVQADEIKELFDLTNKLQADGQYEEMEKVAAKLVSKGEETFGKEHRNTATFLDLWALSYRAQGRFAEAEPLFLRSLEISEKQLGLTIRTSRHP